MTDPDTARLSEMSRLSRRAALLARAEESRPDDDHVPTYADVYGATAIFALLFAAGVVIREGLLIWGLL